MITEEALSVHPSLLGLPLARPWRRCAAMAVDGLLVSLLTQAPSVLFGFAAALVLLRVSAPSAGQSGFFARWTRRGLRLGGAVAFFAAAVSTWSSASDRVEARLAGLGGGAAETAEAPSASEEALAGIVTASLLDPARPIAATDSVAGLKGELASLRRTRTQLEQRVAELEREREEAGPVALVKRFADDLGLGLGWAGLYFTATLALWRGRTPGKRLLGIRVIRLDGKPIGWWVAFERAGGYWAGVATGLLGFFQILWDRNRQAIHDKITETAVVRER